jgi:hypothetical protein
MKGPVIAAVAVATTLVLARPVLTFVRDNSRPRFFKFTAIEAPAGRLCWFFRGHWTQSRANGPIDRFTGKVRCVGRACIGRKARTNLNFGPDYLAGPFEGPIKFKKGTGFCRFVQSSPGVTDYQCLLNIPGTPSTGEGSFRIEVPPVTPCKVSAP